MIKLLFWIGIIVLLVHATKWLFLLLILFALSALMFGKTQSQNSNSSLSQSELDQNILNDGLDDWDLDRGDD